MTIQEIRAEAMKLSAIEREMLAQDLLLSSDPVQQEIDAAWLAEVERRNAEYEKNPDLALDVEEVLGRLRNKVSR